MTVPVRTYSYCLLRFVAAAVVVAVVVAVFAGPPQALGMGV